MKIYSLLTLAVLTSACGGAGPQFKTVSIETATFTPPDVLAGDSESSFYVEDSNAGQWKPMKFREVLKLISLAGNELIMKLKIDDALKLETSLRSDLSKRKDFLEVKAAYSDLFQNYNLIVKPLTKYESPNERSLVYFYDAQKKTEVQALSPIVIKAYNALFLDVMIYLNVVEGVSADSVLDASDLATIDTARAKMEATRKSQMEIIKNEKEILLKRFHSETKRVRY